MQPDPTRMFEKPVGLGDVDLVGIDDAGERTPIGVVMRSGAPSDLWDLLGGGCGRRAIGQPRWWICQRSAGRFVSGGRKRRLTCPTPDCARSRSSSKTPTISGSSDFTGE